MTIQLLSDLHMEFESNAEYLKTMPLRATGDVLVVAAMVAHCQREPHVGKHK